MKATEAKFLDFVKKPPQFVIPIYQRTYSWTERECTQLWDDILRTGGNCLSRPRTTCFYARRGAGVGRRLDVQALVRGELPGMPVLLLEPEFGISGELNDGTEAVAALRIGGPVDASLRIESTLASEFRYFGTGRQRSTSRMPPLGRSIVSLGTEP